MGYDVGVKPSEVEFFLLGETMWKQLPWLSDTCKKVYLKDNEHS